MNQRIVSRLRSHSSTKPREFRLGRWTIAPPDVPLWVFWTWLLLMAGRGHANEEFPLTWPVPGVQPMAAPHDNRVSDREVWLQAYVLVPDAWARSDGLLADSVTLVLESVVDVCEVHLNGQRLGQAGQLTPELQSAREEVHRFKVTPGALKPGIYNTLTLRVVGAEGRAGFLARAPVLAGYHDEILLAGDWRRLPMAPDAAQLVARDERPDAAVFDQVVPATSMLRRPVNLNPGRHLTPEESQAALQVHPDFEAELVLAEPTIAQPLALDFDAAGRLWVVEYRQYPYPAGIQMISRDKYYRAAYDQLPKPPPHHAAGNDRISIHTDTDGDGTYDQHETFVDGLNIVSSIEIMPAGVWVLNPPYLLFYPDVDQDSRPDGDPEVHLQGFGLEDTHSIANSLTWGPDGWLYGAQGSTTSSRVTVVGTDQPAVYRDGAMVWRYHPGQRRYEVFAEGGGNAFGIEIDAQGRLFSGHNGGNTRGFHYLQGGYCQKGTGNKYGPLSNPHVYATIPPMPHAESPRFSHDFVIYDADQFAAPYRGHLFAIDPLQQHIIWATRRSQGATFQTQDQRPVLATSDLAFRPVDITLGPDGSLYVADFCEEYIAHGQHYQGQVDPDTGRVYRLRGKDAAAGSVQAASELGLDALVKRLSHPNRWQRRVALKWLEHRAKEVSHDRRRELIEQLSARVRGQEDPAALEAFWALNLIAPDPDRTVQLGTAHASPHVRAWSVRLLADPVAPLPPSHASSLVQMASTEPHAEVRAQLAASCQRLSLSQSLPILTKLTCYDEDCQDAVIPLMLWWALEKHVGDQAAVLGLFQNSELWHRPVVQQAWLAQLMRRLASGGRAELDGCAQLLEQAPTDATRRRLLDGLEAAFTGRNASELPPRLIAALQQAGGGSLELRVRQRDAAAIQEALAQLVDRRADESRRAALAQLLAEIRQPDALSVLLQLATAPETGDPLRQSSLAALQSYDAPQIGVTVLQARTHWDGLWKREADRLLASRPAWAGELLAAMKSGTIRAEELDEDTVRRLAAHRDPEIAAAVRAIWGDAQAERQSRVATELERVRAALAQGDADPYRGKPLFDAACAKCHQLFREGGQIGPNLTAYRRDDAASIMLQIVNPSLEIREGFETWTVWTTDGRVLTGFLTDQDDHVIAVRGVDGQNVTIARDQIDDLQRSAASLMPEGLLSEMSDQQLRDLFAYLRISQPLN